MNVTDARPILLDRARRINWRFVMLGLVFGFVLVEVAYFTFLKPRPVLFYGLGLDRAIYMDAARDWMAARGFYEAYQFAPYDITAFEILYPPSLLVLLVPFSFLPDVVWVGVPLAITAAVVWSWRPTFTGWLLIGLCLVPPTSFGMYLFGNPGMWVVAAVALATRWPAFGPLVLLKPSLAPFALIGIRHRAWWLSLALCIGFVVLTLPAWLDYATIMLNVRNGGLLHSLPSVPMMLVPLIAYGCRTTPAPFSDLRGESVAGRA